MPKPLHPATVHFPISFLLLSTSLDTLSLMHSSLPTTLTSSIPYSAPELSKAAYYSLLLGLISLLPALTTGILELISMIQQGGIYTITTTASGTKSKTIRPKVKITLLHAAANDVLLAGLSYIAYQRYLGTQETGRKLVGGGGGAGGYYEAEGWQVWGEVGLMGLMLFGANLGGNLTYLYGVGFSSAGGSAVGKGKGKKGE